MADQNLGFQSLTIWRLGHQFVLRVYECTREFPKEERYALTTQFRRAAISIPANIAEGYRRHSNLEKVRFYNIAETSLDECRYYCILSRDLGYSVPENWEENLNELQAKLGGYIATIRSKL